MMKSAILLVCFALASAEAYKRVCYYANWRIYRPNYAKFEPEDIDPNICTHIMYSFGYVSGTSLVSSDEWADIGKGGFSKVMALKQQNAKLKVFLAVGGAKQVQTNAFASMASSSSGRKAFITSAISFLKQHGFDGMDYDWEYPTGAKANFALLVKETYEAFQVEGLGLSAAVSAYYKKVDEAYDVMSIKDNIDFINLMAYDLHGYWDGYTGLHTGLYARQGDSDFNQKLTVDYGAQYWISAGLPKSKLIIGVASYGKTWTLTSSQNGVGAPGGAGGNSPLITEPAFLAYFEICDMLKNGGTEVWDSDAKVPYAYYTGNQWVSYDNEQSIQIKMDYIKDQGFGGGMVWTLNDDDFKGEKCGKKYPIISLMKSNLPDDGDSQATTQAAATTTQAAVTTTQAAATTTQAAVTTTQAAVTTTQAAVTTTQAAATTTAGGSGGNFCAGKADGWYGEPSDSTKYWQCWHSGTGSRQYTCPDGTAWDAAKGYCNWV